MPGINTSANLLELLLVLIVWASPSCRFLQRHAKPPAVSPLHEVESDSNGGSGSEEDADNFSASDPKRREDSAHLVGFKQRASTSTEPLASIPLQLCSQSAATPELINSNLASL